jgi:pimeloyl-ACP methyl ester carboxylesterase
VAHLLYDPEEMAAARTIAALVPGALSRGDIFEPAEAWRYRGYGLAIYRFPGLDGRPVSPPLNIAEAAQEIVDLAARYPDKPLRLLGYSTGGPIVLTAAARLRRDVKIAAMCPAVDAGGGWRTGVFGLWDVLRSALRCGSLRRNDIWLEYYKVLLYGRSVWRDPDVSARADAVIDAYRDRIVMPDDGLPRAHTDDLRHWHLPKRAVFPPDRVRVFIGMDDPVFSQAQTLSFADRIGGPRVLGYPGHGHMLFLSHKRVFDDIYAFFEGEANHGRDVVTLA